MHDHALTPEMLTRDPGLVTATITLKSGENVTFRLLRPNDADRFGRFLDSLSEETRSRFGAHPLTSEKARELCASLDYADNLRLIGVSGEGDRAEVIAYFIVVLGVGPLEIEHYEGYGISLNGSKDCTLAPIVADAYQNKGTASALMPAVIDVVRRLGYERMVLMGGTQTTNFRAIRFYEKFGFHKVGEFYLWDTDNQDMILTLG